jgi:hypothetical protein
MNTRMIPIPCCKNRHHVLGGVSGKKRHNEAVNGSRR